MINKSTSYVGPEPSVFTEPQFHIMGSEYFLLRRIVPHVLTKLLTVKGHTTESIHVLQMLMDPDILVKPLGGAGCAEAERDPFPAGLCSGSEASTLG